MTIFYRLVQDFKEKYEGSVISEHDFKSIYFLDKPLFEVLTEQELKTMIRYEEPEYLKEKNIEVMTFYNQKELDLFLDKINK